MESPKLGPRVKGFKEENDSNNLTLGFRDSITKAWPEIERLRGIFAVTPFNTFQPVLFAYFAQIISARNNVTPQALESS